MQLAAAPDCSRKCTVAICGILCLLVWIVFGRTVGFDFVNYDDGGYIYENPAIREGLGAKGIAMAFTQFHLANWHPLTTLTYLIDYERAGLDPSAYHLTNVLLHGATAVALFLALRSMTGRTWPSAFAAALFAIHPLRVESVAWISERKDVLSGLFFALTLGAYLNYVRHPFSATRYGCLCVAFLGGLMAKSMLVTLPFVLLLLDFWPLGRLACSPATAVAPGTRRLRAFGRLIVEKIPLLLFSLSCCTVTLLAQRSAMSSTETFPIPWRLANALVAYVVYLKQTFLPAGLVVLYPHPGETLARPVILFSATLLASATWAALVLGRRFPYALVGWLWFLGMLVPVSGIIQVGIQAHADRYTYLPQIGLFILLAWGATELASRWRHRRSILFLGATLALAVTAATARMQTSHWRNGQTLWENAIRHSINNHQAHCNLGNYLESKGETSAAMTQYQQALQINPHNWEANNNLGNLLVLNGDVASAIQHYGLAAQANPTSAEIRNNMGSALQKIGRLDEAIKWHGKALEIKPGFAEGRNSLGNALLASGRTVEAVAQFEQALQIRPDYADAHHNLGNAWLRMGEIRMAMQSYRNALRYHPGMPEAMNNLAWLRATAPDPRLRDGAQAIGLAESLVAASGGRDHSHLDTLAAAYAEAGRFAEAAATARRALAEAPPGTDLSKIEERLHGYQAGRAWRMEP